MRGLLQSDMLYVLYSWPTVIISRRTDQYEKAYESLRGHAPNMQKKGRLKGAADLGLDKPSDDAGGAPSLSIIPDLGFDIGFKPLPVHHGYHVCVSIARDLT